MPALTISGPPAEGVREEVLRRMRVTFNLNGNLGGRTGRSIFCVGGRRACLRVNAPFGLYPAAIGSGIKD